VPHPSQHVNIVADIYFGQRRDFFLWIQIPKKKIGYFVRKSVKRFVQQISISDNKVLAFMFRCCINPT